MAGFRRASAILPAALACAAVVSGQLIDRTGEPGRFELPDSGLTLEKRADIYMARKMYREAQEIYGQALEKEPGSARIHNKLASPATSKRTSAARAAITSEPPSSTRSTVRRSTTWARFTMPKGPPQEGRPNLPAGAEDHALLRLDSQQPRHLVIRARQVQGRLESLSDGAAQLDPLVFEHRGSNGTLLQERSVGDRGKYYFFMAKAHAQVELYDKALLYIRKALEEGYVRRGKIATEKAFEPMIEMPAFQRVVFPQVAAAGGPPDP